VPDQRSGTRVTARPDEQLVPNSPIFRRLPPSSIRRCGNDEFAFGTAIPLGSSRADLYGGTVGNANTKTKAGDEGGLSMLTIMRALALLATLLAALSAPSQVFAQKYPDKPVKIIIPFPAGGVTDLAGRLIAQKLSERLGQQFYIENIGGAGGNLGMAQVARAAGDGYTVLISSSSVTVNPSLYNKMPFDVEKDLIPVTKAGGSPNSWLVNPDFPAKTMKELVELMKKDPGKYSVGSPGAGTTPSLSIEQLKYDLKVNFVTVPFAGGGPMTQSLLGGHVPIACGAIGNSVALIKEGKIRALGITAKVRLETLPDVQTLDEMGIKDMEAETMTGVFVPAGTPKAIVDLLQKQISEIVKSADIKPKLLEMGVVPEGDSPEDFAAYVKADIAKWKRIIEVAHINKI
jgi:tripartite-type tricarboxylate transporter receptor subunit TctC